MFQILAVRVWERDSEAWAALHRRRTPGAFSGSVQTGVAGEGTGEDPTGGGRGWERESSQGPLTDPQTLRCSQKGHAPFLWENSDGPCQLPAGDDPGELVGRAGGRDSHGPGAAVSCSPTGGGRGSARPWLCLCRVLSLGSQEPPPQTPGPVPPFRVSSSAFHPGSLLLPGNGLTVYSTAANLLSVLFVVFRRSHSFHHRQLPRGCDAPPILCGI